jgi:hypothetical protein
MSSSVALPISVFLVLFIATGFLAYISYLFAKRLSHNLYKMTRIDLNIEEKIIKDGGATHVIGRRISGGRLILTDKRLIFKSHKNNSKIYLESFYLNRIDKVHTTKTLNILLNGIKFEYEKILTVRFFLNEPESWVNVIQENCSDEFKLS